MFTKFIRFHSLFSNYHYSVGNVSFLKNLPIGSIFFNLPKTSESKKGLYSRSSGTYCILLSFDENSKVCNIQLPSGKLISSDINTVVTLGRNNNIWKYKEVVGKAGRNSNIGFKPIVRGVAMNPVDHPHGGRTKTNSPEKTPWGKIAKFKK